ncbi:major facilitator superfamily domain-containing protein [Diaporthe sp. PMI_573]|nr:major facilitator superfamily domain-containing protein [Diaporthaceae sp. PMI_573]
MSTAGAVDARQPEYLTSWQLYTIIACLCFSQFLIALDANIVTVPLPRISSEFKDLEAVAWYSTAYILTITVFQPLYGPIYKQWDSGVVYGSTIVIFEIGSVLCAAAVNSHMFILGRAVAGFGAAGALQGALSIINQTVALEQRAMYISTVLSVFLIAITVGPVLGGAFTQDVSWRWCFWINLPIGGVVLAGLAIFLRVPANSSTYRTLPLKTKLDNMDPLGSMLIMGAACCLLLALQWGGDAKLWSSADVIGCLVGAVSIGTLFLCWQWKRQERALIIPRVFKRRSVWTGSMSLFFLGAQAYAVPFFLSFWFQAVKGVTPVETGVDFIARLVPQFVFLILSGVLVKKFGHYMPYLILGELICLGGLAMLTQLNIASSTAHWAAALVVTGLGSGMATQMPYSAVSCSLSDDDIPIGNAIALFLNQMGGALAVSIGQTITLTTLADLVPQRLPGLSVQLLKDVGASDLPSLDLSVEDLTILRGVWNTAVVRTMILATAFVGAALPFTLRMEWLNTIKVAEARRQASTLRAQEDAQEKDYSSNIGE